LASINQCTAPCNLRISRDEYRQDIKRLRMFLEGNRKKLLAEMRSEMQQASAELRFEKAARLRDEIEMLESLRERGELEKHEQPEVFYIDPKKGLAGLQKVLKLDTRPRTIEGVDIAHLGGNETVASLVQFIDGLPFKPGYRRFRIRDVAAGDDYAAIREVVARRFAKMGIGPVSRSTSLSAVGEGGEIGPVPILDEGVWPDLLLIDGGIGQLRKALEAFRTLSVEPPLVLSLAKREELIYVAGRDEPLRLSRHSFALRLLQYVRDEAHRFAQHYHHILRKKKMFNDE
jgi:excinuclease ABC subunit C